MSPVATLDVTRAASLWYPIMLPDVAYKPGIPVRMEPNCTRRLLKNLKQDWKQNHNRLIANG